MSIEIHIVLPDTVELTRDNLAELMKAAYRASKDIPVNDVGIEGEFLSHFKSIALSSKHYDEMINFIKDVVEDKGSKLKTVAGIHLIKDASVTTLIWKDE